jgi:hypothetical protein
MRIVKPQTKTMARTLMVFKHANECTQGYHCSKDSPQDAHQKSTSLNAHAPIKGA